MKSCILYLLLTTLLFASCNKEKRYSTKLQKGETWQVADITIDGSSMGVLGSWRITSDTDIYDAVPRCTWSSGEQNAEFEWQFQSKGKVFQLNYYQLLEEIEGDSLHDLDYVAHNLTGAYSVIDHKNKKMSFESVSTIGYSGKKVKITIERN